MIDRLFIIDNNCLNALSSVSNLRRLRSYLRAAGWEFWPTASNVMEAVNISDSARRIRLVETLSALSGDCHALPLATSVLEQVARARVVESARIEAAEPKFTALFRAPETVSDEELTAIREHLTGQESRFDRVYEASRGELRDQLMGQGGRERWPDVGSFLDDVWSTPGHLGSYVEKLWELWKLPSPAPVQDILSSDTWRLYLEGWGAALYARVLQHPQPRLVQGTDLEQLTYLGMAPAAVLATEDRGFRDLANAMLQGRYARREVVALSDMM